MEKSKVLLNPSVANAAVNINHIDFDPDAHAAAHNITDLQAKQIHTQNTMYPELLLRNLHPREILSLSYQQKRNKLREFLVDESFLSNLTLLLTKTNNTRDATLMIVEKAIPCTLHMNMRITGKIVKCLLQEGLNESINKNSFKEQINTYFNNFILLSSQNRTGHWSFPVAIGNPDSVGEITFKGRSANVTLNHVEGLAEICITNDNRKLTWKNIIQKYKEAAYIMDRKHNLSDEEIDNF